MFPKKVSNIIFLELILPNFALMFVREEKCMCNEIAKINSKTRGGGFQCYTKALKKILMHPIWLPVFFYFYNELATGIDPGMALIPFPSIVFWKRQDSNPQLFIRDSSLLTTRPDLSPLYTT